MKAIKAYLNRLFRKDSITIEYDATVYKKIWLTNDKRFYDRIVARDDGVQMMSPDLFKEFNPLYLVGVLQDKPGLQDEVASEDR